ncbi:hypothetical protein GN958_ATG10620 [Phytophthora infestans]|uniref:Uncharacterized protein n=1 Tax=Phytophthora infestans TaxID=4787 RepID=A0A8S9UL21_PHYIN|nr:hypothetical protein GN958_ATG10620 [Phytophthora infestans]
MVSEDSTSCRSPSQSTVKKRKPTYLVRKLRHIPRTQYLHPLHSRIRLGKNWGERRATLMAMRESKLKGAYDYVMARSRFATDSQDSNEQYETDEGDICFVGNTVVKFPGVQSLEQVFEALCFYLTKMEISISETLGHITVREDYDMVEGSAYNARIVSSDSNGISTESNTIVFMQLIREDDLRFGGEPCVVVASDCVDEDELYPDNEPRREEADGGNDSTEMVVTMRRTGYLKLHRPAFPVPPLAQQELEAGIRLGDGASDPGLRQAKAKSTVLIDGADRRSVTYDRVHEDAILEPAVHANLLGKGLGSSGSDNGGIHSLRRFAFQHLGATTVREDYDMVEGVAFNARILSSDSNGITTESNTIVFAQLFEKGRSEIRWRPVGYDEDDVNAHAKIFPAD